MTAVSVMVRGVRREEVRMDVAAADALRERRVRVGTAMVERRKEE